MSYIEVVRPNGTCYSTTDKIGSVAEESYFTVMTERWGKLFFSTEEHYQRWCLEGRRQNEINGCFTSAKYYFDNSIEGNDELMIVEAYQVEDAPAPAPASAQPSV